MHNRRHNILLCYPDHLKHLPSSAEEGNLCKERECYPGIQTPSFLAYVLETVERCPVKKNEMPRNRFPFPQALIKINDSQNLFHRIVKYPELGGTALLALHRTTQQPLNVPDNSVKNFLNSGRLGALTTSLGSLFQHPTTL